LITFEVKRLPAHDESLVLARSDKSADESALIAAFRSHEAAQDMADFFNKLARAPAER
jgi:hypothetical protein